MDVPPCESEPKRMNVTKVLIAAVLGVTATVTLITHSGDLGDMARARSLYGLARPLLFIAALQGDAKAQNNLAGLFAEGLGGRANPTAAARWFEKAADQGVVAAQFNLANFYESGTGVPRDTGKAIALFEKAAAAGDVVAAFNAGSILAEGRSDLPADIPRAMSWYRQAAEAGYASAQHNLASLHARGVGTPRDWDAAALWFGKAAAQGHTTAQMDLGTMLASGVGSTRDFAQGMKLLMSAAGDPRIVDTVKQRIEAVCQTTRDTSEADLCASRP